MPLLPIVGRKSWSTRLLIGLLYAILTVCSLMMIYPFWLMLVTAMTGNADWGEFRLIPRYWYSTEAGFRKYILDKEALNTLAYEYQQEKWFTETDIQGEQLRPVMRPAPAALERIAADYKAFMATLDPDLKHLSFVLREKRQNSVLSLRPDYFRWLEKKYGGNLQQVNSLYNETAMTWEELGLPRTLRPRNWESNPLSSQYRDWREFVASRPPAQQKLVTLDELVFDLLRSRFGSVKVLNKNYGTDFKGLLEVRWKTLSEQPWGWDYQKTIVRALLPLEQIRLREAARPAFEAFCRQYYPGQTIAFTFSPPLEATPRGAWMQFIRSDNCRRDYFDFVDPQALWQAFLEKKYGDVAGLNAAHAAAYAAFDTVKLPFPAVDYADFLERKSDLMHRNLWGNFELVFNYILLKGKALSNTVIFIVLTIVTSLTVNPMAAYVLSRFRLRYAHHILIFLLATMAFPAEVVMIPNFLMIKSFPLGAILLGAAVLLLYIAVNAISRRRRLPLFWNVALGTAITVVAMRYLPPLLAGWFGRADLNVSLMNTFYALVLPGMASGYSIFLLKGFFDSLPPELYEAGMLDGASEIRMFWSIALPMCKPILAVIALGAFSGAYGAFMFAFLTCQDPKMWTLTVFLYEFQQMYSVPVVMASLVVSAIPTLLVFIFCQNIIIRGIVIPTFK